MFKDYNKYLTVSLKVYIFVLFCILIMKVVGFNYFGISTDNQLIISFANLTTKYLIMNNIIFIIPLIINHYVLLSVVANDNSKKMKIYNMILLPIFYLLQASKMKLFGNFSFLIETLYSFTVIVVYKKKITKQLIARFVKMILFIFFVQLVSIFTRTNYSVEYILNPILNVILNLDYIITLVIVYKINFMKGDEKVCGYQEDQCSSSLKQINLKILQRKLQKNFHKFTKLEKVEKITFVIYFLLNLLWNCLTVATVLIIGTLNDTLIECLFIITSFWLSKKQFGKTFHLSSMIQCFIVSNLTYYILNRITVPLEISIIVSVMLGVGLSYVTSKLVKKKYKHLYKGMPLQIFDETILKVTDKDSTKYKICYDFYINKKSDLSLSLKYNYSVPGIQKIKSEINNKIKRL